MDNQNLSVSQKWPGTHTTKKSMILQMINEMARKRILKRKQFKNKEYKPIVCRLQNMQKKNSRTHCDAHCQDKNINNKYLLTKSVPKVGMFMIYCQKSLNVYVVHRKECMLLCYFQELSTLIEIDGKNYHVFDVQSQVVKICKDLFAKVNIKDINVWRENLNQDALIVKVELMDLPKLLVDSDIQISEFANLDICYQNTLIKLIKQSKQSRKKENQRTKKFLQNLVQTVVKDCVKGQV